MIAAAALMWAAMVPTAPYIPYAEGVVDGVPFQCILDRHEKLTFNDKNGQLHFRCENTEPVLCIGTFTYDEGGDRVVRINCTTAQKWVEENQTCDLDGMIEASKLDSLTSASLTLTVTPSLQQVASGNNASVTVSVRNNGTLALSNVVVTANPMTNCNRTFSTLNVSSSVTYLCSKTNVTASFSNTLNASATASDSTTVSASASNVVTMQGQDLQVCKSPNSQFVAPGGNAFWNVDITNNTGGDLTSVLVTDAIAPGCERNVGNLAASAKLSYTCSRTFMQAGSYSGDMQAQGNNTSAVPYAGTATVQVTASTDVIYQDGFGY